MYPLGDDSATRVWRVVGQAKKVWQVSSRGSERQSVPTRWWWWLVGTIKRSNARHDNEGTVGETRVRHQLQAQVGTKLSNEGKFWEVLVQMLEAEGICGG